MASIATNLIGKAIEPLNASDVGRNPGPWPVNEPNASGEHLAHIQAAWVEDRSLKILAVTPSGVSFETYATIVKIKV